MKKRGFRYDEGGEVDALEEYNKGENLDTAPGPKAEPEPEKPKAKAKPPAGTPGGANRGQRAESPSPQRPTLASWPSAGGDLTKKLRGSLECQQAHSTRGRDLTVSCCGRCWRMTTDRRLSLVGWSTG